ncbi:MAG: flagellar assembly protein FliH [Actinomycetota bacterium]|nr:flagellar assembly protein FliH [Actinomycetota bacterium]
MTTGDDARAARPVSFDRPLVEMPGWADSRLARHIAEISSAARQQGLAEGYAAGWAEGRRAAAEREAVEAEARGQREEANRRQLLARIQPLLTALAQTARTLSDEVAPAWDELVEAVLDGTLRLAAASLSRELRTVDAEVLEATRAALRLLPSAEPVSLHVHPSDVALLSDGFSDAVEGLTVVPDPAVEAGSVIARTAMHSLPLNLLAGLRAAEEVLRS